MFESPWLKISKQHNTFTDSLPKQNASSYLAEIFKHNKPVAVAVGLPKHVLDHLRHVIRSARSVRTGRTTCVGERGSRGA
eukprot:3792249-Rhodomonas_salina.1